MTAPVAADGAAAGNFTSNADYIAFDSPSPSLAGPSRPASRSSSPRLTSADPKSKKRKAGAEDTSSSTPSSKQKDKRGKKKDNSESAKKDKGKGKANDSNGVSREPPTGPRNLKEERRAAERGCPWVTLVDWENCNDPAEILNSEIQAFYQYMSPTRVEYEVRLCIIELISRTVKRTWPEAEVHPFGSWQTQLYLPSGDIDLVVTTNRLTVSNKAKLLAELARAMRMAYLTDVVAIISKARVPIIKFVTTQGSLNVDISLNQTNGINAGMIINKYLEILPGARQLIVVVKAFLSQRSMNEVYTGGLGSYSVICLVISFLQVHPKLRRSEIDPEKNLGTLLIEFFELYGRNFNYEDVGLSIRRGGFYYSKQSRGWYKAQQPFTLSIEDPQDKDNNISVGSYGIRQVRATLAGAFEMLQAKLFERAENMYSRENGAGLRKSEPEDMSILSGIMGVTKETLKHRHELLRLHEEGQLQRMLEIPINSDPMEFLSGYQQHVPMPSPPPETLRPRAAHVRDNRNLQAIIVNDDEIDIDDMDSDSAVGDALDGAKIKERAVDINVEVVADDTSPIKRTDRFASVSDDLDGAPVLADTAKEDEDDDSRYALGNTSRTSGTLAQADRPGPDADSDSDSIVAIEPPPTSKKAKAGRGAKRDFWSAKGKVDIISDDDGSAEA